MIFANKKEIPKRGASAKRSQSLRIGINFSLRYPLLILAIAAVAGVALYAVVGVLLSKPVTRVAVTGEFRHVDRQAIADQVQPFLDQGFVRLNLQAIKDELKTRSWVYNVTISRIWPDEIRINVIEQKPIARWTKVGYLNHRGELFKPEKMISMNELPLLSGPEGSTEQVMANFQQLGEVLLQQNLILRALSLDEQGNWIATLDNQCNIVLGNSQVMDKLHRFVMAYQAVLSKEFERIQRIDMRYSNGLAVAWKNSGSTKKQGKS